MFDLSWGVAILGTGLVAVGLGFESAGKFFAVKGRSGRVLAWPLFGLGHVFLGAATPLILWNMCGPILSWALSFLPT
jgi:hypothetical protein